MVTTALFMLASILLVSFILCLTDPPGTPWRTPRGIDND